MLQGLLESLFTLSTSTTEMRVEKGHAQPCERQNPVTPLRRLPVDRGDTGMPPIRSRMKRIIVNADDFGMDASVNQGVIEAFTNGILTSTSMMSNMPGFEHACRVASGLPDLDMGLHLNLARGKPLSHARAVPSLVGHAGFFHDRLEVLAYKLLTHRFNLTEVRDEWRRQIERILSAGFQPTHIDSEKHLHCFPELFELTLHLAREFAIPFVRVPRELSLRAGKEPLQALKAVVAAFLSRHARAELAAAGLPQPPCFFGINLTRQLNTHSLKQALSAAPGDRVTEIMVHPGTPLPTGGSFSGNGRLFIEAVRHIQLQALVDDEVRQTAFGLGIRFISFRALSPSTDS
ncbi:ChbG/HpnK family deacetylase [bacterium]|nr:ChbG/HpnK family deacetylase [candidate division CSSED10-310 bacterium]